MESPPGKSGFGTGSDQPPAENRCLPYFDPSRGCSILEWSRVQHASGPRLAFPLPVVAHSRLDIQSPQTVPSRSPVERPDSRGGVVPVTVPAWSASSDLILTGVQEALGCKPR
jgi:hypothetical protein